MTQAISSSLSPIELTWVRAQTPENLPVTTVALVCDHPLDPACIKSRLEDRLLPEERFRQRIEHSHLPLARPRWREHDRFQLADHFFRANLADGPATTTLPGFISRLTSQPLDEDLPLWQVHLIEQENEGSAVVLRLHNAIADSKAAAALTLRLLDAQEPLQLSEVGFEHRVPLRSLQEGARSTATATRMLCQLITSRADQDNPFRRQPTSSKIIAWSDPVDPSTQPAGVPHSGHAVTETLLAAVAHALRKAVHRQDIPAEDLDMRAIVSLDLRQPGDPLVGTRAALGLLRLPLRDTTAEARLETIHRELERFSSTPEGVTLLGYDTGPSLSMTEIEERSLRLLTQKASASLAILDGPIQAQFLCGQPVGQLLWWPALTGATTLGISLVSYAGQVRFAIASDAVLGSDGATLATDMAAAVEES